MFVCCKQKINFGITFVYQLFVINQNNNQLLLQGEKQYKHIKKVQNLLIQSILLLQETFKQFFISQSYYMKSFAARLEEMECNNQSPIKIINKPLSNKKDKILKISSIKQEIHNFQKNFEDLQKTMKLLGLKQCKHIMQIQNPMKIKHIDSNANQSFKTIDQNTIQTKQTKSLSISKRQFSERPSKVSNNQEFCSWNSSRQSTNSVITNNSQENKIYTHNKFRDTIKKSLAKKIINQNNQKQTISPISIFRQNYVKKVRQNVTQTKIKVGIPNIGNTCYINATVQCLFYLPNFNTIFETSKLQKKLNPGHRGTALRYAELYKKIKQGESKQLSTYYLKRAVSKKCSLFIEWNQQDAHEFIRQLLDSLHQDFNRISQKPQYRQLQSDRKHRTLTSLANQYWNYYRKRDDSLITDYFSGQILSSVICLGCNHESLSFDNFLDLSLPIMQRGVCTLQNLMESFLQKQELPDPYFCSKCKKYNKCTRKLDLWKVPLLLMVHFKRFKYGKYKTEKLKDRIIFPTENFNVRKFMSTSNDLSAINAVYQLVCYVSHIGTMQGGHYYAHCRDVKTGKWYKLDDEDVSETNVEESSEYIYMAFYSRKDNNYY